MRSPTGREATKKIYTGYWNGWLSCDASCLRRSSEMTIDPDGDKLKAAGIIPEQARRRTSQETDGNSGKEPGRDAGGGGGSAATRLVHLALETGIELFHDPEREAYGTITVGDHTET